MNATQFDLIMLILRVIVGIVMFAHGYNHVFRGGKIEGTGRWFESLGMKPGKLHAWLASLTELVVGPMLIVGFLTPLAAAGVVGVMLVALMVAFSLVLYGWLLSGKRASMQVMLLVGIVIGGGLASVATTSPAEAHWRGGWGGWGPGLAGGLVAGAVIGGLASSAYAPGYGYYGGPYAYDYGYDEPYWGGGYTTTYYSAPASYGYRYRRVVRPAYAYYGGSYPVVRHRWHRHHHW